MFKYEIVLMLRQELSEPQAQSLGDRYQKSIEDDGGTLHRREYWGLLGLAYRIKKNRKAHYILMNVDTRATTLAEMERQMRIDEDVLRYLSIRVEEHEEGPSVILRHRHSDEHPSRGPRSFTADVAADVADDVADDADTLAVDDVPVPPVGDAAIEEMQEMQETIGQSDPADPTVADDDSTQGDRA